MQAKRKIDNQIDALHWKIIDYLTKNYKNVIIGDLSTKKVSVKKSKKKSNLNPLTKRVASATRLYQFRQRLENKCLERRVNYKMVTEYYTSQMCTRCGEINIPGREIYNCNSCKLTIGRDINGARNIYLKRLI